MLEKKVDYELVIIGGGITGAALLYVVSKFTNINRIAFVEKYNSFGKVNSHKVHNSQTLHFGDIETNYTLEKAREVKAKAQLLANYLDNSKKKGLYRLTNKMVLAVGDVEVKVLEKRFEDFKELFPRLKKIGRKELKEVEPAVVKGRDPKEKLLALTTDTGYIVDFGRVARSFADDANKTGKDITSFKGVKVEKIEQKDNHFMIRTGKKSFTAKTVVVAAGPHSLLFAQSLGYGTKLGLLPVSGSFYKSPGLLKGKVYTMQLKKLPFAAVHGDPEVDNPGMMRFGPTAKVLPLLERHNYSTMIDFIKTSAITVDGFLSLIKILSDTVYLKYILKQMLYDIPYIGTWFFMKQNVRKIIPSIKFKDISIARGFGGIRPQVIDTEKKQMNMGDAKIIGKNILFDITPSPGASVCLSNAEESTRKTIEFLGSEYFFDKKSFDEELSGTLTPNKEKLLYSSTYLNDDAVRKAIPISILYP